MSEIERSAIERAIFNINYFERDMDKTTRVEKDLFDALEIGLTLMRAELEREKNQLTCDGCKQQGEWDNELEYGYNCPCCHCKRNSVDRYEPKGERI